MELTLAGEAMLAGFEPPPEVVVGPVKAGGVPALRPAPPDASPARVLYLHGGGFVMGSAYGYRPLAGALAAGADVDARLELCPVATHGLHLLWTFLPEAARALDQAGRFVRDVTTPSTRHRNGS
ncbi:hypothetical protein ACQEU6_25280 [Spirillospora sp. CA-108201]